MSYSIDNTEGSRVLKLQGAATIQHVQELALKLIEVLEDGMAVEVDTAELEDIDTSTLQLLCSLRKTVPVLSFARPSKAFEAAVDRCGLRRELLREGL